MNKCYSKCRTLVKNPPAHKNMIKKSVYSTSSLILEGFLKINGSDEAICESIDILKRDFDRSRKRLETMMSMSIIGQGKSELEKIVLSDFKNRIELIRDLYRIHMKETCDEFRIIVGKSNWNNRRRNDLLSRLRSMTTSSPELSRRLQIDENYYYSPDMEDVILVTTFENINLLELLIRGRALYGSKFSEFEGRQAEPKRNSSDCTCKSK